MAKRRPPRIALIGGKAATRAAATALARAGGRDLLRVDLSAVVGRYIGETEKNLARVFARAETADAVLFFDEADARFGNDGRGARPRAVADRLAKSRRPLVFGLGELPGPVLQRHLDAVLRVGGSRRRRRDDP